MGIKIHVFCIGEMAIPTKAIFNNLGQCIPRNVKINNITRVEWADGTFSEGIKHPGCIYYIEGAEKKILIDTGIENFELIRNIRKKRGDRFYLKEKPEWRVKEQLYKIGVSLNDIDIVINTHLHWDHVGGNPLFKNAIYYIQKDEIPLALIAPNYAPHYFKENNQCIVDIADRIVLLEGDKEIVKGLRVRKTGGHTPGSQVIFVDTSIGRVAITGDVIPKYENWHYHWPGPAGNIWNLDELVKAYSIIEHNAEIIVPGHDWKLWDIYPEGIIGN